MSDITYYPPDLKSVTTEPRNVSPCMTSASWSRLNWNIYDENSTLSYTDTICTQFNGHRTTFFLPFATFRQFDWLCLLAWFSARWQWQRMQRVQDKTPEQTSAYYPCWWPFIRYRDINGFICLFGLNSYRKSWYNVYMCWNVRIALYTCV